MLLQQNYLCNRTELLLLLLLLLFHINFLFLLVYHSYFYSTHKQLRNENATKQRFGLKDQNPVESCH